MSYYVMRVCRKTALMYTVDLKNVHFDFSLEITLFFRDAHDALEMYNLLHKYMITRQSIADYQIMRAYEYIRTHENGV